MDAAKRTSGLHLPSRYLAQLLHPDPGRIAAHATPLMRASSPQRPEARGDNQTPMRRLDALRCPGCVGTELGLNLSSVPPQELSELVGDNVPRLRKIVTESGAKAE